MLVNDLTSERAECDTVLASSLFAGSTNSSRLIRYVCEKYFAGVHALSEYDIAVEALGRRPDFDPTQDSIVRVEAHRLRKRLHEYYDGVGAHHELRLVLPQGAYIPRFVPTSQIEIAHVISEPPPPPVVSVPTVPPIPSAPPEPRPPAPERSRLSRYVAIGILVAACVAILAFTVYRSQRRLVAAPVRPGAPLAAVAPAGVLIMAGSSAAGYTDHLGHEWSGDRLYNGGQPWSVHYRRIRRTDDPQLFMSARQGEDFGYNIPLQPGHYELRLFFAETFYGDDNSEGGGESSRMFDVTANGAPLLTNFDPLSDAGGSNIADARVFLGISPASDGKLHLRFQNHFQLKGVAFVNAIQIIPAGTAQMEPIRWVTSNAAVIDGQGKLWLPDQFVEGGRRRELRESVEGTAEPELYKSERYGNFTYSIPVAENSSYSLTLYFSEHWFGIPGYGDNLGNGAGLRVFDVYCNGTSLLQDFDIYKESGGSLKAITRTFHGLRPNHQGKLVLSFVPNKDYPSIAALEVVPEGNK